MASDFAAYVAQGVEKTVVRDYNPGVAAGEVMVVGEFAAYDTTNNWIERAGTDPTVIAGICEVDSEAARVLTDDGQIPIRILVGAGVILALSSATTPTLAHRGDSYGITRNAAGRWLLDVAKTTTASRMVVVDVDITEGIFFCQVHQNVLQFADLTVATA